MKKHDNIIYFYLVLTKTTSITKPLLPQIAQLVEDVRRLQASLTALQEAHAQQLQRLEERLDEKKQHIARLEARLDGQRDYDDIKREIR